MANYKFSPAEVTILQTPGAIPGLEKITQQNPMARHELDRWRSFIIGEWGMQTITEAEKELERVSAVLRRMRSSAHAIKMGRAVGPNDPKLSQFRNDLNALDGWTVSLLETVISALIFLEGQKGKDKVMRLNASLQTMMAKGGKDGNPFDNKHHFSGYMG